MADPALDLGDIEVVIEDDPDDSVRMVDGNLEVDQPDGGVIIQFNPQDQSDPDDENPADFYKNIAGKLSESERLAIANDLIEAIQADDASRSESLATRAKGMDLLGLQIEDPRAGDGAAAMDGMSVVTNPLLLEAILKDWANAQAEFLPADGPCKVEDVEDEPDQVQDDLADAFERDMNYFLTSIATEYAPETSHMLLWGRAFGGCGIKKVYLHPMKKRPTSEKVDIQYFIVSDAATDLKSCERITHVIPMRQSVMKRYQRKGIYLDEALTPPTAQQNVVEENIASIQGVAAAKARPEDQPYTLYECQCELDLDQFAPRDFKGIPLPYLVTIDKDSQKMLALRRDWKPEDEDCQRKRMYVKYPYVPGPGFYGTGLLNILGNSTAAMTAAWRMCLDAGMLANFPAFLIAKLGGRQNTSDFTINPGTGTLIETNGQDIREIVANLPFHEAGPSLMTLIDKITEQSKEVGASANIPVGEGVKDVPVGTMLAHIETSTKLMAATHKLGHEAQAEEISLICDLFREMPEAFWRGNKTKFARKFGWTEEKLLRALNTVTLIPKSDPNIPSHIHRQMRAVALVELISGPLGPRMNPDEVLKRVLAAMREDPRGLVITPPPPSTQPNPDEITAQAKMLDAQTKSKKVDTDAAIAQQKGVLDAAQQKSDIQKDTIDMAKELVIHKADMAKVAADQNKSKSELGLKANQQAHEQTMDKAKHGLDTGVAAHQANLDTHQAILDTAEAMKPEPEPEARAPAKPKAKP
jgi:hypothetical protein